MSTSMSSAPLPRALAFAALLAALCVPPAGAYGPNLVPNPRFDKSFFGWEAVPFQQSGTFGWSAADADGNPHSGSLVGDSLYLPPNDVTMRGPCFAVTPGRYVFGGSFWLERGTAKEIVSVAAYAYSGQDCEKDTYVKGSGLLAGAQGGAWTQLAGSIDVPASAASARLVIIPHRDLTKPSTKLAVFADNLYFAAGSCVPSPTRLCLNGGRFAVTAHWKQGDGSEGDGHAVPFSDDSGSFWFFDPANLELDAKVLDGCGLNQRYWAFAAGLTDLEVTLTVTDTQTAAVKTYNNPLDRTFVTITDTKAFGACP